MHTSYSALNTFLTCPLKYKFQCIDRIKTPQSPEQAFGSLIHRTLKFARTPSSKGYPGKEEIINYFSQNWSNEAFSQEETRRGFFEDGIRILNAQLEKLTDADKKKTIAAEHRFVVKVGDHTLGGQIDRIDRTDQGFEIVDYKTNRKIPPQKEIDGDLQLSIYLRAFMKEWPSLFEQLKDTAKIKLSLEFLRHGLRMSTTRTQTDLQKIDQDILAIIDQVEAAEKAQSFEPRLSALCDWCDYQKNCSLWSHKFKKTVPGEKEIQAIGEKLILLKGQEKELKKEIAGLGLKISEYLSQKNLGQFFAENGSILRQLRETFKYDTGEIAQLLQKWGNDPLLILKVDIPTLNKFSVKLSPEQKRELARLKKPDKKNYCLIVKEKKK